MEEIVMTQYRVKKGLKEFGNKGAKAVLDEIKKIVIGSALSPFPISREKRNETLCTTSCASRKRYIVASMQEAAPTVISKEQRSQSTKHPHHQL